MKRKYEIAVISKAGYARTVRIYAPKKADRAVIMHDGQNVFNDADAMYGKSWRAVEALEALGIRNTAIIGIDSVEASRRNDYLPFPNELGEYGMAPSGGFADAYMQYIEDGIMPYLEKRFGFGAYGMLGSSAGALVTLYYAARHDARFKAYGLFSAPIFFSPSAFDEFFAKTEFPDAYYEVYVGGNEQTDKIDPPEAVPDLYVGYAFKLTAALRKSGIKRLHLTVENEGIHDETSWREPEKRFFKVFSRI